MEQTAPPQANPWPPRRVVAATLIVLAIAIAFWLLFRFRLVFFSLFIAIVLGTAIEPLIARMTRLGISRPISIILVSLFVLLLIVLVVVLVTPLISQQWFTITSQISGFYQDFYKALQHSSSLILRRIAQEMPSYLPLTLQPPAPAVPAQGNNPGQAASVDLVQNAINTAGYVLRSIILLISVLLLTGLWVLEGDVATRFILLGVPKQHRDFTRDLLNDIVQKVGAYTRGVALLTVIVGGLSGLAYLIIGLPNVLLLGLFAGLMEIVPLIGPLLGAIPAMLVAAALDPNKVIWVFLAFIVIQLSENNLIVPRVMNEAVGVNPVVSLLAFLAFGSIFGFLGALLAIPLAAVVQLILQRFVFEKNPAENGPPAGRDALSNLRFETQDLMLDVRKQVRDKEAEVNAQEDRVEDALEAVAQDLDSILSKMENDNQSPTRNNGKRTG